VIDGVSCIVEILDTAGQQEYTALRDQWIQQGDGFVVVYSVLSSSSFTRIQRYLKQIERIRGSSASTNRPPGYSLSNIREDPAATMLVGHHYCADKWQERREREVTKEQGQSLAREMECDFMEASAKNCVNVDKVFYDVVRKLRKQKEDQGLRKRQTISR